MRKEDAIVWMKRGAKMEHQFFSTGEWMTYDTNGMIRLEDGVVCTPEEFWKWRKDAIYNDHWDFVGDAYTSIASREFGVPEEDVTPKMRGMIKARYFAEIYGSDSTIISEDPPMTKAEADELIKEYSKFRK